MTPNVRLTVPQTDEQHQMLSYLLSISGTEGGIDPYARDDDMAFWLVETEAFNVDTSGRPNYVTAGYTAISCIDNVARRCRGMLWVHPDFRGKGIATEALKKRNAMLFDEMNMHRIEWVVPIENDARLHIATKLGQRREGVLKEAVYYNGRYHDLGCFATLRSERQGY